FGLFPSFLAVRLFLTYFSGFGFLFIPLFSFAFLASSRFDFLNLFCRLQVSHSSFLLRVLSAFAVNLVFFSGVLAVRLFSTYFAGFRFLLIPLSSFAFLASSRLI